MTTLSVISYIERINRVYRLIRMERTGSVVVLGSLLGVSRRAFMMFLEQADNHQLSGGAPPDGSRDKVQQEA